MVPSLTHSLITQLQRGLWRWKGLKMINGNDSEIIQLDDIDTLLQDIYIEYSPYISHLHSLSLWGSKFEWSFIVLEVPFQMKHTFPLSALSIFFLRKQVRNDNPLSHPHESPRSETDFRLEDRRPTKWTESKHEMCESIVDRKLHNRGEEKRDSRKQPPFYTPSSCETYFFPHSSGIASLLVTFEIVVQSFYISQFFSRKHVKSVRCDQRDINWQAEGK